MTQEDIDCFREKIDSHIQQKHAEIDTNIAYILVGSLGFFVTMLDKFIEPRSAHLLCVGLLSPVVLIFCFSVFLFAKYKTASYSKILLKYLDETLKPNTLEHDKELFRLWKIFDEKQDNRRFLIYGCLFIGVVLQIFFFVYNILHTTKDNTSVPQIVKIEVVNNDSLQVKTMLDSLKNTNYGRRQKTPEK